MQISDFIKGKDCGYSQRGLLVSKDNGTSVYPANGKWIMARIRNGVCWHSKEFKTRREAIAAS